MIHDYRVFDCINSLLLPRIRVFLKQNVVIQMRIFVAGSVEHLFPFPSNNFSPQPPEVCYEIRKIPRI